MITNLTITDDQIRALQRELIDHPDFGISAVISEQLRACHIALEYEEMHWIRDERAMRARTRVAEILNDRAAQEAH